jgi:hypothetical protein
MSTSGVNKTARSMMLAAAPLGRFASAGLDLPAKLDLRAMRSCGNEGLPCKRGIIQGVLRLMKA